MRRTGPFSFEAEMQVYELIREFSSRVTLPVDVNDLLPILAKNGEETNIEFVGVDLNPEILQGQIKVFHVRNGVYAEPERCANIYYHRGHTPDWQRFICCKELLHLLDPENATTSDPDAIDTLAEKIGLPPSMQDPLGDGFATNIDRLAEFRAAAILLPFAAREQFLKPLADRKLSLSDIAEIADIPRKYVGLVMSPRWEGVHELFIKAI